MPAQGFHVIPKAGARLCFRGEACKRIGQRAIIWFGVQKLENRVNGINGESNYFEDKYKWKGDHLPKRSEKFSHVLQDICFQPDLYHCRLLLSPPVPCLV